MQAAAQMDAMYRLQRHIYDLTRKPYLLGRDSLIRELDVPPRGRVLEIACGTARNLLQVSRAYPGAMCFGVDISAQMLETARAAIARQGAGDRVWVTQADATSFDPRVLFGVENFDRVIISYALSMIPCWEAVLAAGAGLLAPGGALHVVDFGDQARLPAFFRAGLLAWLRAFHVTPRDELSESAAALAQARGLECRVRPLYLGYATSAVLRAAA